MGISEITLDNSRPQFDPSLAKLRRLLSKPNWRLGWYIWLRTAFPSSIASLVVSRLGEPALRKLGVATQPTTISVLAGLLGFVLTAVLAHWSIRKWLNCQNMSLSGWLGWSFFWRWCLVQGLIVAAAFFVFLITASVVGILAMTFIPSARGAFWLVSSISVPLLFALLVNVPACGWAAHRVILAYSRPNPSHRARRTLVRTLGVLTVLIAVTGFLESTKDLFAMKSTLRLTAAGWVLFGTALVVGIGLLNLKTWARWIGVTLSGIFLLLIGLALLKGTALGRDAWILVGVFGCTFVALVHPAIKEAFKRSNLVEP